MSCYVYSLCMQYTRLSLTKLQAKQILSDFIGNWWTVWHQREVVCQRCTNNKMKSFCTLAITLIWLQEIMFHCEIMLWVLYDMWWLIWNNLGQNILINSNVCGFFPFPSATWKTVWWRWVWAVIICLPIMRRHVLAIHFDQTSTSTF